LNPADALFTKIWFNGIKVRSGLTSSYAIARALELKQANTGGSTRPRNIKGYETGSPAVSRDILARAEGRFPGSAQYFDTPLKCLLRGDAVDAGWIEDRLLSLPMQITAIVLHLYVDPVTSRPVAMLLPFEDQTAKQLAAVGGLHALEAAVLLMKLGEIQSTPELRRLAREAYIRIQPSVRRDPVVRPMAKELFRFIDLTFPLWVYVRPDFRCVALVDVVPRIPAPRSPEQILAAERSPLTSLALARIEIERRILERRLATISSPTGP
jgi:hypothetical protein